MTHSVVSNSALLRTVPTNQETIVSIDYNEQIDNYNANFVIEKPSATLTRRRTTSSTTSTTLFPMVPNMARSVSAGCGIGSTTPTTSRRIHHHPHAWINYLSSSSSVLVSSSTSTSPASSSTSSPRRQSSSTKSTSQPSLMIMPSDPHQRYVDEELNGDCHCPISGNDDINSFGIPRNSHHNASTSSTKTKMRLTTLQRRFLLEESLSSKVLPSSSVSSPIGDPALSFRNEQHPPLLSGNDDREFFSVKEKEEQQRLTSSQQPPHAYASSEDDNLSEMTLEECFVLDSDIRRKHSFNNNNSSRDHGVRDDGSDWHSQFQTEDYDTDTSSGNHYCNVDQHYCRTNGATSCNEKNPLDFVFSATSSSSLMQLFQNSFTSSSSANKNTKNTDVDVTHDATWGITTATIHDGPDERTQQ